MEIDETYDSFTLDNDFKLHYKNRDSAFIEGVLRVRHGSRFRRRIISQERLFVESDLHEHTSQTFLIF